MKKQTHLLRASSAVVAASLLVPFVSGCGSPTPPAPVPGSSSMQRPATNTRANTGMTTKQKVVLLAGAAALYYYYNRSKKANAAKIQAQDIQYYRSKSTGQIYYRDPRNPKQAIFVSPPTQQNLQYSIPASEAAQYQGMQGYDGASSGQTLADKFEVR